MRGTRARAKCEFYGAGKQPEATNVPVFAFKSSSVGRSVVAGGDDDGAVLQILASLDPLFELFPRDKLRLLLLFFFFCLCLCCC